MLQGLAAGAPPSNDGYQAHDAQASYAHPAAEDRYFSAAGALSVQASASSPKRSIIIAENSS